MFVSQHQRTHNIQGFSLKFYSIHFYKHLQAVTNRLPDCEVGIHGNQDLKAHCSARDNRREESGWVAGLLKNQRMLHDSPKLLYFGWSALQREKKTAALILFFKVTTERFS